MNETELKRTEERLREKGAITDEAPRAELFPAQRPWDHRDFRARTAAWEALLWCRRFFPWRCAR